MALSVWLVSSLERVYPGTLQPKNKNIIPLATALNEQSSFQVAVRNNGDDRITISLEIDAPSGIKTRIRQVGYVPQPHYNTPIGPDAADIAGKGHIPGYVPDPLFDGNALRIPPGETHCFWVTLKPAGKVKAGSYQLKTLLSAEDGFDAVLKQPLKLYPIKLKKRNGFDITNWFYADSLIDWYQTDMFDKRFWEVLSAYQKNMADHGQNMLYVPVFTPPLDGVKRPHQLLKVTETKKGSYRFNWRDVKRYIDSARKAGIQKFEWSHPFTQWGVKTAIRIYHGQGETGKLLWKPNTGATSTVYRNFLEQYLPQLERFLKKEKLMNKSVFHVSDEPHGEEHLQNYRKARNLLKELAPWMKVMDALTEIEFARQGLTDMPVPSIRTALDFNKEGISSWCYYCCGPRGAYLNRLMDTPLAKIAMHGLLFYRWPFKGFLHWGYNYWYQSQTNNLIDPYQVSDGLHWEKGWAYGDTFMVYPGENGPVDSIRWEILAESLQDYQLLQTLGIERNDPRLKALRSFEKFPKKAEWRSKLRSSLLEGGRRKAEGGRMNKE